MLPYHYDNYPAAWTITLTWMWHHSSSEFDIHPVCFVVACPSHFEVFTVWPEHFIFLNCSSFTRISKQIQITQFLVPEPFLFRISNCASHLLLHKLDWHMVWIWACSSSYAFLNENNHVNFMTVHKHSHSSFQKYILQTL